MIIKNEKQIHENIIGCLAKNFGCKIIKEECTILTFYNIDQIENEVSFLQPDIVGYNSKNYSLYIVEAKKYTHIGTKGVCSVIGQIIIDNIGLSLFGLKDLRHYLKSGDEKLGNKPIEQIFFYIALPNIANGGVNEKIRPSVEMILKQLHKELNKQFGVFEIFELDKPARVYKNLIAEPILLRV